MECDLDCFLDFSKTIMSYGVMAVAIVAFSYGFNHIFCDYLVCLSFISKSLLGLFHTCSIHSNIAD